MAVTLDIKTRLELEDAQKKIAELEKKFEELSGQIKNSEKAAKDASKATQGMSKATKALGGAMKALGIGLIIAALATLREMIMSNQKVMDAINITLETIGNVFNQITEAIGNAVDTVSESTGGFDALGKVLKSLLTLSLVPLQAAFYGITLGVQNAQLAWEKSMFGDDDPETVKRLTEAINETETSLKEVALGALEAGKTIGKNIGEAIGEVSELGKAAMNSLKDVSIDAAHEAAKANISLQNSARLAAAEQQILIEQYDRQAEKLRQIRDDDMKSMPERIKANEDLAAVLEKQTEIMLKGADLQIAAAAATLERNNNIENQVALLEAQANKEGILAQIEGFRSEQLMNRNSLLREQAMIEKEIEDQKIAEEKERLEQRKEFEKSRTAYEKEQLDIRLKQEMAMQEAKLSTIGQAFAIAQQLSEGNEKAQKKIAAAEALFNTYLAINKTLAAFSGVPIPGYAIVQAIATGAFGLLQVKKILSTKSGATGGSISGGGGGGGRAPEPRQSDVPDFSFANRGVGNSQNANFGTLRAVVIQQEIDNQKALAQKIDDQMK